MLPGSQEERAPITTNSFLTGVRGDMSGRGVREEGRE